MSLKHLAVGAVTVGLALTACSSSKAKSGSSTPSSSSAASSSGGTTTAPPAQNVAADKARGVAAGLKLSDFPGGWTEQARTNTSTSTSSPSDVQFAKCVGVPLADLNKSGPADYTSPDFKAPPDGNPTISGTVGYQATAAESQHAYSIFSSDKATSCLSSALTTVLNDELQKSAGAAAAGVTVGKASVTKQDFPTVGDATVEYRVVIPITAAGQNITTYIDLVIATKGRVGFETDFQNIGSAVPADQEKKYVQLVASRLQDT